VKMKKWGVGDDVWIWTGVNNNKTNTKGKIIAEITLPRYSFVHYVIEVDTPIDPLLYIRSGSPLEMWDHEIKQSLV
jgi:hypothetical protein